MIPWGARGQQRNARRIESYTKTGTSGVRVGAQVALSDDQARQAAANSQAPDYVRIFPRRLAERRDACAHKRAGSGAGGDSISFGASMVVALNQEPIAGHHPENSTDRCQSRELSVRRIPVEERDAG